MLFKVLIAVAVLVAVTMALPPQVAGYGEWGNGGFGGPGAWGPPGNGGFGGPGAWGPPGGFGGPGAWGNQGNPWLPPWIANAPWMPKWGPCTIPGPATCTSCNTKAVCTKVGQLTTTCSGTTPFCNEGKCSATPSAECAVQAVPISA